jgi:tRNA-2-methylthio-N6-dimethylallyladenosine synthase
VIGTAPLLSGAAEAVGGMPGRAPGLEAGGGRRVYIERFGCQMNDYDVERLTEVLRKDGYERTDVVDDADLVLLETCAIREKAEAKVASAAGRLKAWRSQPGRLLAIGGCVAQQEGARILKKIPHADLAFGPDQIPNVPALLRRASAERRRIAATDVIDVEDYAFLDADPRPGEVPITALVTIQKGCDNHCAYCVVPHTRGREVSRPAAEVIAEVERFVAAGAREVTLIGQNVNSYHGASGGRDDFAELLARVDAVPGLARLRFTTSHPKDFTDAVARAFGELPRLCPWLHLPVQSGSDDVLRRMKRDYTAARYLAKIDAVRGFAPDVSISTDIIVGYPGETLADHRATLSLLERAQFDMIYSFAYSSRPNTSARELADDVPADEKSRRLHEVQAVQRAITAQRLARFVGRTVDVLVEGESRQGGQACGRTGGNQMVNFQPPADVAPSTLAGQMVSVRIEQARTSTLVGGELLAGRMA